VLFEVLDKPAYPHRLTFTPPGKALKINVGNIFQVGSNTFQRMPG